MSDKKHVLLIGDNEKAKYHPLRNVQEEIVSILQSEMEPECREDYGRLLSKDLPDFDLCISYVDCWEDRITPEQTAGLLKYVGGGGGLLIIHNGISFQQKYEYAQIAGARFTGHPPYQRLSFQVSCPEHDIMQGIHNFEMEEEPYRFEFDPFTEKTVLLQYEQEGNMYPAAWAHEFGLGRVVYLMPGHLADSFRNTTYREVIRRSARWVLKCTV